MGNKKRIQKKIIQNQINQKRKRLVLGFKFLAVAIEIQKKLKIDSQTKVNYPIGGIVNSKENEIIIDNFGNAKGIAIPLKRLEGMLALEKTKNGQTKTVFAGSRDYKDDFGIQASASWIDVFKKMESKKIESTPSFLNFLQDEIRKRS